MEKKKTSENVFFQKDVPCVFDVISVIRCAIVDFMVASSSNIVFASFKMFNCSLNRS